MAQSQTIIIVPAYNESGNIAKTIEEIRGLADTLDIVVVDDGSTDDTALQVARAKATVISLPFNLGIGGAVQTGFQYAENNGYDFAVQVDGDGQHDVSFLAALIDPVRNGKANIAVGSRFLQPFLGYRSSFVRRIGIHFFAHLLSFLTGCRVTDPTSGFRAFDRRAIRFFAESYPADFPEPESVMTARRAGLTVVEVPVKMRKRLAGHSSIRYLMTLYYMIKVTFAILLSMIKVKKRAA